ncbi:MAG: M20 family metallo-hydrolase [Treponema sp.]|jgi:succinyl-diaminopimelate desuccinylase|nr:M20 family metallo-hydrolase [Treponema sp.]
MTIHETLSAFIEKSETLAVELETELCRRPAISPDSGGEGELEKCRFLEGWLKDHGITRLERYDAPDPRARGGVRPNLIATIPRQGDDDAAAAARRPDGGMFGGAAETSGGAAAPGDGAEIPGGAEGPARLWIMSHLDVVPPGEASLWKSDPWTVTAAEGGTGPDGMPLGRRLIGRGVEDNQQGLVSSVLAALAFRACGIAPARTVKLLFAADEENGSAFGVEWLLTRHGYLFRKNDMVLIPDGGDRRGASIEIAEKSLVWARFVTRGLQAHGSRPDRGANAHLAGAALAVRLHEDLSAGFPDRDPLFDPACSTFEPTKKEANVPNVNTIPGEDVFYMDMRILPRYPVKAVLAAVDTITAGAAAKYGVTVTYTLLQRVESRPTAPDAPLITRLSRAVERVYGVTPRPVGIGGGTVGACLRNRGIDAAVWCRIDDTAHQPGEYALIANILGDARVMALLMTEEAP